MESMDGSVEEEKLEFMREMHKKYCLRTLQILPGVCESYDSTRLVILYFAISTLDLLNELSTIEDSRSEFVDWIYHLQVVPNKAGEGFDRCGFRGSAPCTVFTSNFYDSDYFDQPQLAMTYSALVSLIILGDDLSRVDKKALVHSLKYLQLPDGSFRPTICESENDMRFIYCACCISYILRDWSGINVDSAVDYIQKSITYEGGIAQGPGLEAHGGSTFCAIASLSLMKKLNLLTQKQLRNVRRWCHFRQIDGFQGRPNKPSDTCYSFWVGATLKILKSYELIDLGELKNFIFSTQDPWMGGIAKCVDHIPDPLHTYLSISGLSLMHSDDILPVHPALNISQRAFAHLKTLHEKWSRERR